MSVQKRSSVYDRLRPHLDAGDLIRRLGLTESRVIGSEAYLNPLCHESSSGESLQINLHTGRWNCKACQSAGMYGDLIQLVEYVLTGGKAPSRGPGQTNAASHRDAITWLCDQFGIAFDESRITGDPGLDVVHAFSMSAHQYLLTQPGMLDWIQAQWGFDRATVEAYGIGYMPSPILPSIASEAAQPKSKAAFRASGLGWYSDTGQWKTHFAGRVTFPYLEHGRAVYLIGRSTPATPPRKDGGRVAKYHKLSVHSEKRPYISERVTNDHLYNEAVMSTTEEIGVLEGVTDAVAISSLGLPVVSPVTITFNAVDLERFLRKCGEYSIHSTWILFDNELSGSGEWGARRTGIKFVQGGLTAKVLALPLGDTQKAARAEVVGALGAEAFAEFERSDPRERKQILAREFPEKERLEWVITQINASKIDAAEWTAMVGAGAAGKFSAIYKAGKDVVHMEIEDAAKRIEPEQDEVARAAIFSDVITLVAHIEERLSRASYAGAIAAAAGKGVTKAEISKRIATARRDKVKPKREQEKKDERVDHSQIEKDLVLLPPEGPHASPPPMPAKPRDPNVPPAPKPPGEIVQTDHERYASARDSVAKAVEAKYPEEALGEFISQTIMRSMGYTVFRTPDELYLVRGAQRIAVGMKSDYTRFLHLIYLASGLTTSKNSHRAYISATIYFLERDAKKASDVAWSYVDDTGAVFFPTGDRSGSILKIEPGKVTRTKMAEVKVPAVAGKDFEPFVYTEEDGGIQRMLDVFRWTSLSPSDRLVLIYWIVCLPVLRRIGTVPIVRIEGGSSSGKTRTIDAVSFLVDGRKKSSVPTAPALISRLSMEMLTFDDNRETCDVSPSFLGTLLQATHLGAREKRKSNSDTGTVVERVCGALILNGIEPIHDGKSELASRMLTLRCSENRRAADSPRAEGPLINAILQDRSRFWSESVRRCSYALALDQAYGEPIGAEIETLFGATRIGRLSSYLRIMYFAWVAGLPEVHQSAALGRIGEEWREAFQSIGNLSLQSLLAEELAVTVVRYVFAYAAQEAQAPHPASDQRIGLGGKYNADLYHGEAYLGPLRATHLARLARHAGKELNAPRSITSDLRSGQLERRLLDGIAFLEAAGYAVDVEMTRKGKHRFTFRKLLTPLSQMAAPPVASDDAWDGPASEQAAPSARL